MTTGATAAEVGAHAAAGRRGRVQVWVLARTPRPEPERLHPRCDRAMFNIVLVHPEIPPNTGNVIRLAANTGCALHLVEPLGFSMDDKLLRRAGLDYHEYATRAAPRVVGRTSSARPGPTPTAMFAFTTRGSARSPRSHGSAATGWCSATRPPACRAALRDALRARAARAPADARRPAQPEPEQRRGGGGVRGLAPERLRPAPRALDRGAPSGPPACSAGRGLDARRGPARRASLFIRPASASGVGAGGAEVLAEQAGAHLVALDDADQLARDALDDRAAASSPAPARPATRSPRSRDSPARRGSATPAATADAAERRDAQRLQLAGAHLAHRDAGHHEAGLHLPGEDGVDHLREALVGHVQKVDPGTRLEQLHRQVRRAAVADAAVVELARLRLRDANEFGQRVRAEPRARPPSTFGEVATSVTGARSFAGS